MTLTCRLCQTEKPECDFDWRKDRGTPRSECKACRRIAHRATWARDKAKNNAAQKAHYAKNRAALLAKQMAYAEKNRDREAERSRQWRKDNPERVRELNQRYAANNRDKISAKKREYAQENPDVIRHNSRMRKARVRAAPVCDLTKDQWAAILKRHEHSCVYCGVGGDMTQDHDIPISRGGGHTASNVVPACLPCNMRKHDKTGAEYRALLDRERQAKWA